MATLTTPGGSRVSVPDEKVPQLVRLGWTPEKTKPGRKAPAKS